MPQARASQVAVEVLGVPRAGALVAQASVEVLSAVPLPDARVHQLAVEVLSTRPRVASALDPSRLVFVAAITAAVDDAGTTSTFYATTGRGWVTGGADTPADEHVAPTLSNPGTYRRELFSGNRPYGAVRPAFGVATLTNLDGRYDAWKSYGFDGRRYTVYAGEEGAPFPGSWQVVFRATIQQCDVDFREVRFRLRDDLDLLDKSILIHSFAGTGGVEGSAAMTGVPKPRTFQAPFWHPVTPLVMIPPVLEYAVPRQLYDVGGILIGSPESSETIFFYRFPRAVTFDAGMMPSKGGSGTAATSSAAFSVQKNGVEFATMTWATGATTPTFASASSAAFSAGDVVSIVSPATVDATLADLFFTLSGFVEAE